MGIFDRFKKKPSHTEKIDAVYKCYKPEMVGMVFPGGKEQVSNIITSLGRIYNIDLESCDAKKYLDVLSTYSDVLIRRVVTQSEDAHIITSLQVKHGELVINKDIVKQVLAYVTINMSNNAFKLETEEDMAAISLIAESFSQAEQVRSENAEAAAQNLDDPEYGLVVNKPIYTNGVRGSNSYLASLKTTLGETLTWNRLGSTSVEGVNGIIDIYESHLPSGKPYKTLYLNMYGSTNSNKIPKGFSK